jgi:hypothetical protein
MRSWIAAAAPLLLITIASAEVRGEGFDRDTLLTDAPATPDKGTVRVSGYTAGKGATATGADATGSVTGSISWTPFAHVSGDVGVFYQGGPAGGSGPSARVRYQFLSQDAVGVDMAGGIRFKTVSFSNPTRTGELEFLLAAGRRLGQFDLALNGVFGMETGGGSGKDVEVKGFAGYRLTEALRAGIDSRLQAEVGDTAPAATPKVGRDFDLTVGPAVSWLVLRTLQLQALVGAGAPKGSTRTVPVGLLAAAMDF